MLGRSSLIAALAAVASIGSGFHAVADAGKAVIPAAVLGARAERRLIRSAIGSGSGSRRPGPGWSNRQVQRMALKKRNRARNRAAHR